MKLIRAHHPASRQELENLIAWHAQNICASGIVSKGTIGTFGKNLYNAPIEYWVKVD